MEVLKMVNEVKTIKKSKYVSRTEVIDPGTGEFIPVTLFGQANEFRDKDFTKVFHAFTLALIQDEDIAGKSIRLLFWIIGQLKQDDIHFYMSENAVRKELNLSKATYFSYRKTLIKKNIIKKVDSSLYMINPACVAVGKAHQLLDVWNEANEVNKKEETIL